MGGNDARLASTGFCRQAHFGGFFFFGAEKGHVSVRRHYDINVNRYFCEYLPARKLVEVTE